MFNTTTISLTGRLATAIAVGLCVTLPARAQSILDAQPNQIAPAAMTDPYKAIYRVAGVYNSGAANTGVATTFACSSFSPVLENVKYIIRSAGGSVVVNKTQPVSPRGTAVASTHATQMSGELVLSSPGALQGSALIRSTTDKMVCSAMIVDASSTTPIGVALHMVRLNPLPKTEE